jgi:hypothetical protein
MMCLRYSTRRPRANRKRSPAGAMAGRVCFGKGKLMRLRTFPAIVALAAASVVACASVSKADITYIVTGTFDDSTALSGRFTVDVYGYVELSSLDLTTVDGTISGYVYTGASADPDGCGTNCVGYGRTSPPYFGGLQLTFANPLGSPGPDPIIGYEGGPSWENLSYSIGRSANSLSREWRRYSRPGACDLGDVDGGFGRARSGRLLPRQHRRRDRLRRCGGSTCAAEDALKSRTRRRFP